VGVPLSGEGEHEVFEITVVGCGADEFAAGMQRGEAPASVTPRIVEMFHHLGADDEVERLLAKPCEDAVVRRHDFKARPRIGGAGLGDPRLAEIDPRDPAPFAEELATGEAVPATHVEHARARGELAR